MLLIKATTAFLMCRTALHIQTSLNILKCQTLAKVKTDKWRMPWFASNIGWLKSSTSSFSNHDFCTITANASTVPSANKTSVLLWKHENQITFKVINWMKDITLKESIKIAPGSFVCKNYRWLSLYKYIYTIILYIRFNNKLLWSENIPKIYVLGTLFSIQ